MPPDPDAHLLVTTTVHVIGPQHVVARAYPALPGKGCVEIGAVGAVRIMGSFDDLRATLAEALRAVIATEATARAEHYSEQARLANVGAK